MSLLFVENFYKDEWENGQVHMCDTYTPYTYLWVHDPLVFFCTRKCVLLQISVKSDVPPIQSWVMSHSRILSVAHWFVSHLSVLSAANTDEWIHTHQCITSNAASTYERFVAHWSVRSVAHIVESLDTHTHINLPHRIHHPHMDGSCHNWECFLLQIWMHHVARISQPRLTHTAHIWMGRVTFENACIDKYGWVMSHISIIYITHITNIWMGRITLVK